MAWMQDGNSLEKDFQKYEEMKDYIRDVEDFILRYKKLEEWKNQFPPSKIRKTIVQSLQKIDFDTMLQMEGMFKSSLDMKKKYFFQKYDSVYSSNICTKCKKNQ